MSAPPPSPAQYVLLVDDVRSFTDGRPAMVARTAAQAIEILRSRRHEFIAEIWLDHDLAGRNRADLTVMPVVEEIAAAVDHGEPYDIGVVNIHTSNPHGAVAIKSALDRVGIRVVRWHNMQIFLNRRTELDSTGESS
jgi:hypothetical protein